MNRPTIVFDLDGTLIDTAVDLLDSLNFSLGTAGLAPVSQSGFRTQLGMGGRVMIERAFAAVQRSLADGELDRLHATFLDHYTAGIPGRSALYPGAAAALERFAGAGYLMAICTNKLEHNARSLLEALGTLPNFAAISGQDTFTFRKPDPRHLIETVIRAGGTPDRAVMIGDSRTDIDTAKAAGIPVIAVDFGYTDRHVREFEPSHIVSHFDEISLDLTERLMSSVKVAVG
jgi:phosphoglycolate phosphatase